MNNDVVATWYFLMNNDVVATWYDSMLIGSCIRSYVVVEHRCSRCDIFLDKRLFDSWWAVSRWTSRRSHCDWGFALGSKLARCFRFRIPFAGLPFPQQVEVRSRMLRWMLVAVPALVVNLDSIIYSLGWNLVELKFLVAIGMNRTMSLIIMLFHPNKVNRLSWSGYSVLSVKA